MSSLIQFLKALISGNDLKGIKFRTFLAVVLSFSVLIIEIVMFYVYWDSIPDIIHYDYDLDGHPNSICEKKRIWYNILFQIFIVGFVFIIKQLSYKTKRIRKIVFDKKNQIIPIMDKRFSMMAWETAMLFITTEQSYIFTLAGIINDSICDDVVTLIFLFWQIVLIIEFKGDIKKLKEEQSKHCNRLNQKILQTPAKALFSSEFSADMKMANKIIAKNKNIYKKLAK